MTKNKRDTVISIRVDNKTKRELMKRAQDVTLSTYLYKLIKKEMIKCQSAF